ncbi:MAG: hypothetical protein JWP81_1153 [Ferruginibacter sp.]|nr:hypothetical protein [Ferruginibacter sp.]
MKEYMMIFRNEKMEGEMPSAEQMQMVMQQWQSWITAIANQGKYSGTNRLLPEGKTIKPNNIVTDGPYMEAKEMVGGYLVVKANSLADALEMAQTCPNLVYGGNVEVRAVMTIDNDPNSPSFLQEKN